MSGGVVFKRNNAYAATSMAANLLFPLAAIPFLTRCLGADAFGELAIAQATAVIFCQVVDYGFSLSGAREIAGNKVLSEISLVYSKYQNARLLLLIACALIFSLLLPTRIFSIDRSILILAVIPAGIGAFLQSNWFFQGRGLYGWLALANLMGKSLYLAVSIWVVKEPQDIGWAAAAFGGSYLVSGVISWVATLMLFKVTWSRPTDFSEMIVTIRRGTKSFISLALLSIHMQLVILLTGHFVDSKSAGLLSVLDKMARGLSSLSVPIANTAFPVMSDLLSRDIERAKVTRSQLSKVMVSYGLVCLVGIAVFGAWAVGMLFKVNVATGLDNITKIVSLLPIFIAIGVVNGGLTLVPAGFDSEYLASIAFAETMALIVFFATVFWIPKYSGVITIVVAEGCMAVAFYLFARSRMGILFGIERV
ncbi:oligosaccharide flippase family protein [Cupriavidus sp. WS]|uniref:oligosaccharide flippase family protein n=1 Tax=Cupriavidus sp. WS TaxID=1312922 RepID=UPI00039A7C17|nr:oligosaccharide flippase family protein [Cupriavidus sp. WS]